MLLIHSVNLIGFSCIYFLYEAARMNVFAYSLSTWVRWGKFLMIVSTLDNGRRASGLLFINLQSVGQLSSWAYLMANRRFLAWPSDWWTSSALSDWASNPDVCSIRTECRIVPVFHANYTSELRIRPSSSML